MSAPLCDYLLLAGLKRPPAVIFGRAEQTTRRADKLHARRMRLLMQIERGRAITTRELSDRSDTSATTLRNDLHALLAEGHITRGSVMEDDRPVIAWSRA